MISLRVVSVRVDILKHSRTQLLTCIMHVCCVLTKVPTECVYFCSGINIEIAFTTVDQTYKKGNDDTAPVRDIICARAHIHTFAQTTRANIRERFTSMTYIETASTMHSCRHAVARPSTPRP
jgi:hypothetical protein